jgi:hypothetical protein
MEDGPVRDRATMVRALPFRRTARAPPAKRRGASSTLAVVSPASFNGQDTCFVIRGSKCAIGWFTCAGYTVCLPLTDSQPYDLVVDDGVSGLQRVSVKSTTRFKADLNVYDVGLRTVGGNKSQVITRHFDRSLVELLFVAYDNGLRYLIPTSEFEAKSELRLGTKYARFKV